jgi:hypothetical protein
MNISFYSLSNANRKKRAVNGNPVQAYVEYLVVTDVTIYNDHSRFINSTDPNLIYQHIRIYFAYLVNGINQRYANGFFGDQDLNLNVQLTNFLILTVNFDYIKKVNFFKFKIIDNEKNNVNWTDPAVVGDVNNPTYNGKPVIVTRNALLAFTNYMNALTLPFTYDHAAGFFK